MGRLLRTFCSSYHNIKPFLCCLKWSWRCKRSRRFRLRGLHSGQNLSRKERNVWCRCLHNIDPRVCWGRVLHNSPSLGVWNSRCRNCTNIDQESRFEWLWLGSGCRKCTRCWYLSCILNRLFCCKGTGWRWILWYRNWLCLRWIQFWLHHDLHLQKLYLRFWLSIQWGKSDNLWLLGQANLILQRLMALQVSLQDPYHSL